MLNLCVTSAYLGRPFTDWRRSRVALKMHTRAVHENCSNHTFGWEQGTASAPSCGWSVKAEVQISVKSFWATFFICDALLGSIFPVSWGKFFFGKLVERGLSLWDRPLFIFHPVFFARCFSWLCDLGWVPECGWMEEGLSDRAGDSGKSPPPSSHHQHSQASKALHTMQYHLSVSKEYYFAEGKSYQHVAAQRVPGIPIHTMQFLLMQYLLDVKEKFKMFPTKCIA